MPLPRLAGLPRLLGTAGEVPAQPDYWRLWFVGLILHSVRWLETIVVAIFVYQITASAFLVAVVTMLRMAPMGLFGAFLGALTDRLDRRTGLIFIVSSVLISSSVLAALAQMDRIEVWHLALASFVNGIGWAADHPVRRMMIGDVVGLGRLNRAMSIEVVANQVSRVAGPAIGGITFTAFGLTGCFAIEAAACVAALIAALGVGYRNDPAHAVSSGMFAHIREGLHEAGKDARLRGTLIVTIVFNVFAWPCTSMIPVIGKDNLHLAASGIGILASVDGLGAILASILIAILARPNHYAALYLGGTFVCHLLLIAFALAPSPMPAAAALAVFGLGGAAFTVMQATLVYQLARPAMRGRILGLLAVCIGVAPIGFLQLGILAEAIGAQRAVVATATAGLVVLILVRRFWMPLWRGAEPM